MIRSFRCRDTQQLFETGSNVRFSAVVLAARRKLQQLDEATSIGALRSPPGNRLEALRGNRVGQFSIRINKQFRVCFRWSLDGADDVEILDYH